MRASAVAARVADLAHIVLLPLFAVFATRSDEASAFRDLFANGWLWIAVAGSVALQFGVLYLPPLQRAFNTVPLDGRDWILAAIVASSVLWVRELAKLVRRGVTAGARARAV